MAADMLDRINELYPEPKKQISASKPKADNDPNEPLELGQVIKDTGEALSWDGTGTVGGSEGQTTDTDNSDAAARDEVQQMQAEAPLLDLIRQDTGETGNGSRDYVAFKTCPICGHRDCFRYYPKTNTWACFGGSNTKRTGGGYLEYLQDARDVDATESMKSLRDATGHPYEERAGKTEKDAAKDSNDNEGKAKSKYLLPRIDAIRSTDPPKRSPVLIDGLLRRGHIAVLVARAKSCKSWAGIALCVSVSCDMPWLGYEVSQGRCLYIDPELDAKSLNNRFHVVAESMGADLAQVDANVSRWSLRGWLTPSGKAPTIADVSHDLGLYGERYDLVIVDSCSALLAGDENASGDVRSFFNCCLRVAEITGASVLCIHHESKAKSGDRDASERGRGSSVWNDAPDLLLSLVETFPPDGMPGDYLNKGERAFLLEPASVREFPPSPSKRLIWSYPTFRVDHDGITEGWKPSSSQQGAGRASGASRQAQADAAAAKVEAALLASMLHRGYHDPEDMSTRDACEIAARALGRKSIGAKTLRGYLEQSQWLDVWAKSTRRHFVVPRMLAHPEEEEEEADMQLSIQPD